MILMLVMAMAASALGYFFPERWPAQLEYVGEKTEGERRFLVVRATPRGGRPFDVWIDAHTDLLDRTVEKASMETRTVFFFDYREVRGVRVAFAATPGPTSSTAPASG